MVCVCFELLILCFHEGRKVQKDTTSGRRVKKREKERKRRGERVKEEREKVRKGGEKREIRRVMRGLMT